MLSQLQQRFTRQSKPQADSNKSLMLWGVLGFVLGFSPIVIFLVVFVPATKSDKPVQRQTQQAMVANKLSPHATTRTASELPPPAMPDQPLPASNALPANDNEHERAQQPVAMPAMVQVQETKLSTSTPTVTTKPITPSTPGRASKHAQAALTTAEANKPAAVTTRIIKKQPDEKTALKNKQGKIVKRESRTKTAAVKPEKPSTAPQPGDGTGLVQRPEDKVVTLVDAIVYQRWEQNNPGSVFPQTGAIECSTDKEDVVCWTDVLTGKHNSREYRYKIKMILDKFRADKQFVMTYRNLILSSGGKPSDEEAGGLGALPERMKPGWAPMINRLPCQLAGHDKIVCSPVGENQFVLIGTDVQTSLRR